MERFFYNMVLYQDFNSEIPKNGLFFPLAFIDRNSKWTDDQVSDRFGSLITIQILKWVFFSVLLFFGLLSVGFTVCFTIKCLKLNKQVKGKLSQEEERKQLLEDTEDGSIKRSKESRENSEKFDAESSSDNGNGAIPISDNR